MPRICHSPLATPTVPVATPQIAEICINVVIVAETRVRCLTSLSTCLLLYYPCCRRYSVLVVRSAIVLFNHFNARYSRYDSSIDQMDVRVRWVLKIVVNLGYWKLIFFIHWLNFLRVYSICKDTVTVGLMSPNDASSGCLSLQVIYSTAQRIPLLHISTNIRRHRHLIINLFIKIRWNSHSA